MVKVRSDGNGGLDINVQKAMLRKWGPLAAATMLALGSMSSGFGSELFDLVLTKRTIESRLVDLESDLARAALRAEEAKIEAGLNRQLLLRLEMAQETNRKEVLSELGAIQKNIQQLYITERGK